MVSTLDRKLLRDLSRLKGQVLTIALVVAAGIAAFVSMRGNYVSLERARDAHYERSRFGDVFAHLERAPEALRADLSAEMAFRYLEHPEPLHGDATVVSNNHFDQDVFNFQIQR